MLADLNQDLPIPSGAEAFETADFKRGIKLFLSPDGHAVRFTVFHQGDPLSEEGTSHIVVQVVYDEPAILDDYEGVDIETLTRELSPKNPFALNLMRITVDGEPLDDPGRSSADIQRFTDDELEQLHLVRFLPVVCCLAASCRRRGRNA